LCIRLHYGIGPLMHVSKLSSGIIVSLAFAVLAFIGCSHPYQVDKGEPHYDNPIRIGLLLPISEERTSHEGAYLTTILAAEEINESGGVLNRKIEIVFKNDGGSATMGVEAAQSLCDEGIEVVPGPMLHWL
jgi:ABC-type branched-subunit amino acid transport system substrate-binding protein